MREKENMANRPNFCCIFVLFSVTLVFQTEKCNGQFHWGKNHRLEVQKLKDMINQLRPNNVMMAAAMVRTKFNQIYSKCFKNFSHLILFFLENMKKIFFF